MGQFCLYIDESGRPNSIDQVERPYIVVGCAIETKNQAALKERADILKKKYWPKTSIVLHHSDLANNKKDFQIFAGQPELKQQFETDLIQFLRGAPVVTFVAIVDKYQLPKTWTEATFVRKTARAVFFNYIAYLYSRPSPSGKIVIEAADSHKNQYYLEAFAYFLSPTCPELDSDFAATKDIKEVISSLTFVTKNNNDIETQIADIFGYAAYCAYQQQRNKKTFQKGSYEYALTGILNQKLFQMPDGTTGTKRKFFSKVESFQVIPN